MEPVAPRSVEPRGNVLGRTGARRGSHPVRTRTRGGVIRRAQVAGGKTDKPVQHRVFLATARPDNPRFKGLSGRGTAVPRLFGQPGTSRAARARARARAPVPGTRRAHAGHPLRPCFRSSTPHAHTARGRAPFARRCRAGFPHTLQEGSTCPCKNCSVRPGEPTCPYKNRSSCSRRHAIRSSDSTACSYGSSSYRSGTVSSA